MTAAAPYPASPRERDRFILARRDAAETPRRDDLDPWRPVDFLAEEERAATGEIVPVATLFLANRECPFRCLMCDLWQHTLTESVPPGAIPAQIDYALERLPQARHIKLYNSGSFFDPRAIPPADDPAIARRMRGFERVVVEAHPAFLGERALRFRDLLEAQGDIALEVAIGLETVHPEILPRLNKRMSLDQFADTADFLRRHDIALRVFVLVKPPFLAETEARDWAGRSVEFAFENGATAAALIPTRDGNGALEALAEGGDFSPPCLATFEAAVEDGVRLGRGRVFADLWDLERFADCSACFPARRDRLRTMNRRQVVPEPVACARCGGGS